MAWKEHMRENYSIFSYEFLNRDWDKKTWSLITTIGYRHRTKSKLGIKKKEISFDAGINPTSFSCSIRSIEFKTNQHFNYDNVTKQVQQAIMTYYKNQNQIYIQVNTKYIKSRWLKVTDITLYGYLKG